MESAQLVLDLTVLFTAALKRILEAVLRFGREQDGRTLEECVEQEMKALGATVLETVWRVRMKEQVAPESLECECGQRKHRVRRQPCTLQGALGPVELRERYYYYCDHCGTAGYWGDELRGGGRFTQLAEERLVLVGSEVPYERAAVLLKALGMMEVAGSTIQRTCRRLGQGLRRLLDRQAVEQYGAGAAPPEDTPDCLAIGVDGTMVGRVDVQHRARKSRKTGRKVRGKTALRNFFHEVKLLVAFDFDRQGQALRKTFYATQAGVEEFRQQVQREGARRGAGLARRLVFLGDGALWVWKTAAECFPKAIQILDWYHAVEHLWAVGRALHPTNTGALGQWVEQRKAELWAGKVERVLAALRQAAQQLGEPNPALSEEAREADPRWIVHRNIGYFEENRSRMDYPRYRAENLPIGSGEIESACKYVVGDRLKRSGMRWDEDGAENILALRCQRLNARWDYLWPLKHTA